ncbi:MAG TPA: hypothetical protein VFZ59_12545 [Verrucomicrobiae bacterium]|nr:hypothetical protein [Verrucomicrobiae bacterium]
MLRKFQIVVLLTMATGLLAAEAPRTGKASQAAARSEATERLLASGKTCAQSLKPAEALVWYRQAALAGSMDAVQLVGELFLRGQTSAIPEQAVPSNIPEGIRWTFWAATNMHPAACRAMARVYFEGVGVKTNLVHAYAWMRLFSELDRKAGASELDRLVRHLEPEQIREAQELVADFKKQQWPPSPCKKVVEGDSRLTLSGISLAGDKSLAVINRRSVAQGETATIALAKGELTLTCLEISAQSIVVDIAGENEARLLRLR